MISIDLPQKKSPGFLSQVQYCIKIKRKGTKGQNSDLLESSNQECLYSTMLGWCRPEASWICKKKIEGRNSNITGKKCVNICICILVYLQSDWFWDFFGGQLLFVSSQVNLGRTAFLAGFLHSLPMLTAQKKCEFDLRGGTYVYEYVLI